MSSERDSASKIWTRKILLRRSSAWRTRSASTRRISKKPKRLRMCYDYSHYDFRDMTLEGTIKTALPFVGHIAVKDVVRRDKRLRFVLPGQGGRIDYARLIGEFHAGGYRGDICVEISGQVWSQPGYDPVAAAKTCYQHLAGAFAKSRVPRPA